MEELDHPRSTYLYLVAGLEGAGGALGGSNNHVAGSGGAGGHREEQGTLSPDREEPGEHQEEQITWSPEHEEEDHRGSKPPCHRIWRSMAHSRQSTRRGITGRSRERTAQSRSRQCAMASPGVRHDCLLPPQIRGSKPKPRKYSIINSTCIHLRVKGPNIYMYSRGRIYKEPLEKYNNRKG
jgi:hypothetical protein